MLLSPFIFQDRMEGLWPDLLQKTNSTYVQFEIAKQLEHDDTISDKVIQDNAYRVNGARSDEDGKQTTQFMWDVWTPAEQAGMVQCLSEVVMAFGTTQRGNGPFTNLMITV